MATKKMGRPTESLKDYMLRVRIDTKILEKLDYVANNFSVSRSEIVRKGIEIQYDDIKKQWLQTLVGEQSLSTGHWGLKPLC